MSDDLSVPSAPSAAAGSAELAQLTALLGGPPPNSVGALAPESLRSLIERIESGRRHHAAAADRATEQGLRSMPLPMRAVVKRTLS
ncbi:hypothetical protein [uncultured Jatrophihabitans sp.]|uniref:hypothetical protein n=1 Tax=uncultured Jatrophihabitans sp. TaxID=1610747 RepID=UPI0035CC1CA3